MFKSHFINGDKNQKIYFKQFTKKRTKTKTMSKKMYFKKELDACCNNEKFSSATINIHKVNLIISILKKPNQLYIQPIFCTIRKKLANNLPSKSSTDYKIASKKPCLRLDLSICLTLSSVCQISV